MELGAIILVGGLSTRMGTDKATLVWNGRGAVDRLSETARQLGARRVLTAGQGDYGLPRVEDPIRHGGPVAGIMAGAAALQSAGVDRLLVLAVDAATILPCDVAVLVESASPGACYEQLNLPLAIDLRAAPPEAGAGWSIRRFASAAGLQRLPCAPAARDRLRGANTPAEREALLAALVELEGVQTLRR